MNTKVKEKDAKKSIKCKENTVDIKIRHEYKVPSNSKVQESKSKKKCIKVKVKKMELRSKDRFSKTIKSKLRKCSKGSTDKIFVSSPVKKMDKKDVLKVQKKEKKKFVKKEEKSVQYDKEENKEGVLGVSKYFDNRWKKREDLNERHISHIDLDFDKDYLHNQKIPGYCLLCTSFYSSKPSVMKYHFARIHKKHSIVVNNLRHLFCKCRFVPSRGGDNKNRNLHFHCCKCHKPCDKEKAYRTHLVSKHNII